eukprot:gene16180-17806_t
METAKGIFILSLFLMHRNSYVDCICSSTSACYPVALDVAKLASFSSLNVTSTCGSPREQFCSNNDCNLYCDASSESEKHPPSYLIDTFSLPTYWKSKNLVAPVTIQLTLNQKLILHQVVTTFSIDVPSGVYLERSQDFGRTYQRLVYFARNCLDLFSLPATDYQLTNVVCLQIKTTDISSKTISYMPRTNAQIQTEVLKPGAVRDHFIFTNLKFVLHDYVKPSNFNPATADPKKYFFSLNLKDISDTQEDENFVEVNLKFLREAVCYHLNFRVLVNVSARRTQQEITASDVFLYSTTKLGSMELHVKLAIAAVLPTAALSMPPKAMVFVTAVQTTLPEIFATNVALVSTVMQAVNVSVNCGCDVRGVNLNTRMCNEATGICQCKPNVQGLKCNTCNPQFWGLSSSNPSGCQACNCRTLATVNGSNVCDATSGQCLCLTGFTGRTCNTCKVGYYSSVTVNPTQCTACGCDPSGSYNSSCSSTGACYCRPLYSGIKCKIISSSYYSANVQQLLFSSLNAHIASSAIYFVTSSQLSLSQGSVTAIGYSLGLDTISRRSTNITFTINLPSTSGYEFVLRYMTSSSFNNVTMTITRQSSFASYSCMRNGVRENVTENNAIQFQRDLSAANQNSSFGTACLANGQYTVMISIPYYSATFSNARIVINSLLVLPSYEYSSLYQTLPSTTQSSIRLYYRRAFSLTSWAVHSSQGAEYLSYLYGTVYTSALACQCDVTGSTNSANCTALGGQCACMPRVTGRRCDSCLPDSFNFTSGSGCTACNCNSLGSTNISCNAVTGMCTCKPNVHGEKCGQCISNHYGINSGNGCMPCGCSQVYSTTQQCHGNGTCICKPGIGGRTCSQCMPGYHNLTSAGCSLCSCNTIGSVHSSCNTTDAACLCKQGTEGASCSACKSGYYGFDARFPQACLKCQCSGHTSVCSKAAGFYEAVINTTLLKVENHVDLDGWTAVNENAFLSGTLLLDWSPNYNFFRGYAKLTDTRSDSQLYFSAPAKFLGDKRASYMLKLMFDMTQQNNSQPFNSRNGDVILKGNEVSYTLVTNLSGTPVQYPHFNSFEVKFDEQFWRINRTDGPVATGKDMIAILRNLKALLIRAKWATASGQFSGLASVRMQYSSPIQAANALLANNVESCSCPAGYTGLSCERCSMGYTKATPNGLAEVKCVRCNCNNHASSCDPVNGTCLDCQHFTTGNQCQQCVTGYYGNATRGTSSDCLPCPCPGGLGSSNQFSSTCQLGSDGQPTCHPCQVGYSGRRCEVCADGYSGNPMIPGGRCTRCICSNNIDISVPGNCNQTTGQCSNCIYNTTGPSCEWCQNGTFGNAASTILPKCQDCACNLIGSYDTVCNNLTGQCRCRNNVFGRTCDRCVPNAFNFTSGSGCQLCNCNALGSNRLQCLQNGTCSCKPRVTGDKCDRCMPGYYDISRGCLPCECSANYTEENTTCNPIMGQCVCKSSLNGGLYGGRQCNQCGPNAIGTPPNCDQCREQCYDNWQRYIATETASLANLTASTNTLLQKFGSMSYSAINSQLVNLNGNLTYAATVFDGAQYNTKSKEAQFQQIEASIITYESAINRSESQLAATQQYFQSTSSFNGTVNLDSTTPTSFPSPFNNIQVSTFTFSLPATASPASVTTMANGLLATSTSNNMTGRLVYTTTVQNYNQIQTANQSIAQAATDIANAMKTLSTAATERAKAQSFINTDFQATYDANAIELQAINTIVESTKTLLSGVQTTHAEAMSLLANATAAVNQAETTVNSRRTEANSALVSATEMRLSGMTLQSSATATQTSATLFKTNADAVNHDAQQTASSVAASINKVATIRNQTSQVIATANRVNNQSLPVSAAEIQSLSTQIMATSIDETQINQTLIGAADGLKKAQDVQTLAQQALNASNTMLNEVNSVTSSLTQAESIRNATKATQADNEVKAKEIQNITTTVQSQFKNLQSTGTSTLALVNTTTAQVNASMKCFSDAKKIVDNATLIAQAAQNSSAQSLTAHQSNSEQITSLSSQVTTTHTTTQTQNIEVQNTKNNATQLLSDVTEAERLLAQFVAQSTELSSLQTEAANLESELDGLIAKFEQTSNKLSTCNRN